MNAIYGESLLSFAELFKEFLYFNQSPLINGGYDDQTPSVKKRGVFKDDTSRVKDAGGNWIKEKRKTLWVHEQLVSGTFIWYQGLVYRIMTDTDWPLQAGFYIYALEKVVGDNGTNTIRNQANTGGAVFT